MIQRMSKNALDTLAETKAKEHGDERAAKRVKQALRWPDGHAYTFDGLPVPPPSNGRPILPPHEAVLEFVLSEHEAGNKARRKRSMLRGGPRKPPRWATWMLDYIKDAKRRAEEDLDATQR